MAGGAAQQRAQPRQHFLHVEGFGDVIVGAGVEALHFVAPAIARRQNEHRHGAAVLAPGLEDGNAVAFGQADVEHDRVIGLGVAEKPAFLAVESAVDRVARRLQRRYDLPVEIAIVFDNQQAHDSFVSPLRSNLRHRLARIARADELAGGRVHRPRGRAARRDAAA